MTDRTIRFFAILIAAMVAFLVLVATIASCSQPQVAVAAAQPAVVAAPAAVAPVAVAPAPVVVQQSHDGFFTGMLMGHLLSGGGGYATPHSTVVNKTVVNKTVVNKTVQQAAPPVPTATPSVIPKPAPYVRAAPTPSYAPKPSYTYSAPRVSYSGSAFRGRR